MFSRLLWHTFGIQLASSAVLEDTCEYAYGRSFPLISHDSIKINNNGRSSGSNGVKVFMASSLGCLITLPLRVCVKWDCFGQHYASLCSLSPCGFLLSVLLSLSWPRSSCTKYAVHTASWSSLVVLGSLLSLQMKSFKSVPSLCSTSSSWFASVLE